MPAEIPAETLPAPCGAPARAWRPSRTHCKHLHRFSGPYINSCARTLWCTDLGLALMAPSKMVPGCTRVMSLRERRVREQGAQLVSLRVRVLCVRVRVRVCGRGVEGVCEHCLLVERTGGGGG